MQTGLLDLGIIVNRSELLRSLGKTTGFQDSPLSCDVFEARLLWTSVLL
jgi:hypothetical protein